PDGDRQRRVADGERNPDEAAGAQVPAAEREQRKHADLGEERREIDGSLGPGRMQCNAPPPRRRARPSYDVRAHGFEFTSDLGPRLVECGARTSENREQMSDNGVFAPLVVPKTPLADLEYPCDRRTADRPVR